jgi:hypothetical protein
LSFTLFPALLSGGNIDGEEQILPSDFQIHWINFADCAGADNDDTLL